MNHTDHEIEMARSELYSIAKYAIALHEMLENVSELEGMEGWQQSKITKAADYMESVYQSLTHEMKFGESAPKGWEGTVKAMKKHKEVDNPYALAHYMKNKGYKSHKKEESVAEGMFGIDDKIKGRIQNIVSDLSDIPGMWNHKAQTFTDAGMDKLKTVLKNNPKYIKYALNLDYRDYEAEGVAEAEKKGLYYYVNKRKKAGTSRDASSPKAPSPQDWKNAAKTAKKESVEEAGYGRNKGYAPGFASPTAPPLRPVGGPKQDDEYVNGGPVNNIEVSINGRPWKIFPGKGPDGSRAFFQQKQDVDEMCKRKTAATGKKWSWGVTGEPATNESVEENKKGVRAVKHTTKPRNPVMAGDKPGKATITHKNKKKDAERGVEKHKGKEPAYESRLWNALSNHLEK